MTPLQPSKKIWLLLVRLVQGAGKSDPQVPDTSFGDFGLQFWAQSAKQEEALCQMSSCSDWQILKAWMFQLTAEPKAAIGCSLLKLLPPVRFA